MRIAAIDIGTNSIHMIVVQVRPDLSFEVIDREKDMVRLGHGDSRLSHYRHLGGTPERIIGLLAEWCGLGERREQTVARPPAASDPATLPCTPTVFPANDDAWLRA
mgnify:CR=1 FL=1